jgi:AGZA family xanthine/uracil permease-like MFS transporter
VVKGSLAAAGVGGPNGPALDAALVSAAHAGGSFIGGGFALEQGFLYAAMIWAAIVVGIVDRAWHRAAAWCGVGALLSALGLMHSYVLTGRDTVISLPLLDWLTGHWTPGQALFPAGGVALGYLCASLVFLSARYLTLPRADDEVA